MDLIWQWCRSNLDIVYFIYGFAFLVMGISIFAYPKKASKVKLAKIIWLIAAFGVTHGISEFLDMWEIIKGRSHIWDMARWFILAISYVFIFEFGKRLFLLTKVKSFKWNGKITKLFNRWLVSLILLFIFLISKASFDFWTTASILTRYLLCFPGALLTGLGFFSYYKDEKNKLEPLRIRWCFTWAGLVFLIYGILGGIVVPKGNFFPANWLNTDSFCLAVRIPVQVFRAFCALISGVAVVGMLRIFKREFEEKLRSDIAEWKYTKEQLEESEQRFKAIFDAAMDGILLADIENKELYNANKTICQMLGYSIEEIKSLKVMDIHPKEALASVIGQFEKQAKGEISLANDVPMRRRDSSVFYVDVSSSVITLAERKYLLGIFRDITERKEAEEALRASENKYRTLCENLPQKVFYKDRNSVYVSCNKSYAQDLKIKTDEILGKQDYEFFPKELAERYRADDKRIMDSGKAEEVEEKYIQDGKEVIVHTVKTPIKDEKENIIGILGIFWDITEKKKAEEVLKEYTKKIEQINKELDDFTYIVSHDLKEPLKSIYAFSKFLEDDYKEKIEEEGRGYIQRIRANSIRMQNLIEDLLEISRIERRRCSFEEVPVFDLLNEVKLRLEYSIKEKNAEVVIQDNLPKIFCDWVRLIEVFANLFSNAIKFNDKPNPRIEVGCNQRDDCYEFYVKDNGPGIEQQYYERIFEIFQRLGKREDTEGTGAGLTIAKKIIKMHKGKIWVDSKIGEYTTFYFTIPKRKQAILGKKKLGEMLVEKKLITGEELKKTLEEQKETD